MDAQHSQVPPNSVSRVVVSRVAVVVPAHDEELLLDACLTALVAAARTVERVCGIEVTLILVLDACTDGSARIAARHPTVSVVEVAHRNVGAARAAGFAAAGTDGSESTWFATTDADTVVGPGWLLGHCRHAATGVRALAGTVNVDFDDHFAAASVESYHAQYRHEPGHSHVHGANFGVLAHDYWAVGGFASVATAEDHDLVRRLESAGTPCVRVCDIPVTTSGRLHGRAPAGFAGFLRALEPTP